MRVVGKVILSGNQNISVAVAIQCVRQKCCFKDSSSGSYQEYNTSRIENSEDLSLPLRKVLLPNVQLQVSEESRIRIKSFYSILPISVALQHRCFFRCTQ